MAEQRLIDATSLKILFEHEYRHNKQFKQSSAYKAWQGAIQLLYDQPTIDPETLPIVRQLREELAQVTAEKDAAVDDLSNRPHRTTCKHGERCDYISVITGMPDCHSCEEWEWRGPQKEE